MNKKNWFDLGWVAKPDGSEQLQFGVKYPKKQAIHDAVMVGLLLGLGLAMHQAFKQTYFAGAKAGIDAEYEALDTIGCLK